MRRYQKPGVVKVHEDEAECRICRWGEVQAAHLVHRSRGAKWEADLVIPLCVAHHNALDEHRLELLPYLTLKEQAAVVRLIGIERAYKRLTAAGPKL